MDRNTADPEASGTDGRCLQSAPLVAAAAWYVLWVLFTWIFEGRIHTMLRPAASVDRLVYAGAVNIAVGQVGALLLFWWLVRRTRLRWPAPRFGPDIPARLMVATIAAGAGSGCFLLAGGAWHGVPLLTNAFAQVFVVSAAEVIVCWGLIGLSAAIALSRRGPRWSTAAGAAAASIAFGLYHAAHSPPFNTPAMIAFLTIVGLVTSVFFFATRDLPATIVFHNFPAVAGVTRALLESGKGDALNALQPALLATAALSLVIVLAGDNLLRTRTR